jgi:hypothetical protein
VPANSPRIATIPPQIHHQKTTFYGPFFSKNPCKNAKTAIREKLSQSTVGVA